MKLLTDKFNLATQAKLCPVCFQAILFIDGMPIRAFKTNVSEDRGSLVHNSCEIKYYKKLRKPINQDDRKVDESLHFLAKLR